VACGPGAGRITSATVPIASAAVPIASAPVPIASGTTPIASAAVPIASAAVPIASGTVPIASATVPIASATVPIASAAVPIASFLGERRAPRLDNRAKTAAVTRDERLAAAIDRGWRASDAADAAYARGELDDDAWHRAAAARIVPAYLAAATPSGGSGHSGSADDWEYSRGLVADALERPGTFLDVGCANGLLMESVARWGAQRGLAIEPYGLDIAPELAALARRRYPAWAERIVVGNALGFRPPFRFDVVRTGLEYVPPPRRRELVEWLLAHVVAPGGRLVIGKYNEELAPRALEVELARAGFTVAGRAERAHRTEPRICYRVVWIDVI
jgi:SAM-dependent methyltransferase